VPQLASLSTKFKVPWWQVAELFAIVGNQISFQLLAVVGNCPTHFTEYAVRYTTESMLLERSDEVMVKFAFWLTEIPQVA
jgi:hypothetical protein